MTRRLKVQLVALFGICVAAYAWNVENQLDDPFYEPACSGIFGGNCGEAMLFLHDACYEYHLTSTRYDPSELAH